MLREISSVHQLSGECSKRWFSSTEMDVFVWQDSSGNIEKIQCSYNKVTVEKAILWSDSTGFSHVSVDTGERPGKYPASPVFNTDFDVARESLRTLLDNELDANPPAVLSEVLKKIRLYLVS